MKNTSVKRIVIKNEVQPTEHEKARGDNHYMAKGVTVRESIIQNYKGKGVFTTRQVVNELGFACKTAASACRALEEKGLLERRGKKRIGSAVHNYWEVV